MPSGNSLKPSRMKELENYIRISKNIVREAYRQFNADDMRLVWSGHKDSTLTLWIWKKACAEYGLKMPKVVTINEGDQFAEVDEFLQRISREWGLVLEVVENSDLLKACNYSIGAVVSVNDLNQHNREEIKRIGFKTLEKFPFQTNSFICHHLLKSVALNNYIAENNVKVIIQGFRWDEKPAKSNAPYFEKLNLKHLQHELIGIYPILHITERALWDIYHHWGLPYVSLYQEGYRSLGAKSATVKISDVPAWKQDLENTGERAGRSIYGASLSRTANNLKTEVKNAKQEQDFEDEVTRRLHMLGY